MSKEEVWEQVEKEVLLFKKHHDISDNWRAVQEIVLGGSMTWRRAHELYKPKEGDLVLDIGANAGIYSAYCGAHGARVLAFEPGRNSFGLLSEMVRQSNLQKLVHPIKAAISYRCGLTETVEHHHENNGLSYFNGGLETMGVTWGESDKAKAETVPMLTLMSLLSDIYTVFDCAKIDIEGAEAEVILSSPEWVLRKIKFMYIEVHDWMGSEKYEAMVGWLRQTCKTVEGYTNPQTGLFEALYVTN